MVGLSVSVGRRVGVGSPPSGVQHATVIPIGMEILFTPAPDTFDDAVQLSITTGVVNGTAPVLGNGASISLGTPTLSISSGATNTPSLLGSASDSASAPTVTSLSLNVTVPSGVNQQALLAAISYRSSTTTAQVSSVTWTPTGGSPVALTVQGAPERHVSTSAPAPLGTGVRATEIWGLLAPVTGTGTLLVTFSVAVQSSRISAYSAPNVAEFGPVEVAQNTNAPGDSAATVTAIPIGLNSTYLAAVRFINGGGGPLTPGAGTTELLDGQTDATEGSFDNSHTYGDIAKSSGAIGTPVTLSVSATDTDRGWGVTAIELKRTVSGGGGGPGVTGEFWVHNDGRIYDPSGTAFTIAGTCLEKGKFTPQQYLTYMGSPGFNLNTVRIMDLVSSSGATFSASHQTIMDGWLAGGKVCYYGFGEQVGGFATPGHATPHRDLNKLKAFYAGQANIYGTGKPKANPRSWFTIYNEAGSFSLSSDASVVGGNIVWSASRAAEWKTMISEVIQAVRNTGARAPIIVPALVGASDVARLSGPTNPFTFPVEQWSSIIRFYQEIWDAAPDVVGDNGIVGKQLIFHLHGYTNYRSDTTPTSSGLGYFTGGPTELRTFLQACKDRGICIMFEETGLFINQTADSRQTIRNLHALRRVYNPTGFDINALCWQFDGTDSNNYTTTDTGAFFPAGSGYGGGSGTCDYAASVSKRCSGTDINSLTNPTNLTLSGKWVWDLGNPGTFPPGSLG